MFGFFPERKKPAQPTIKILSNEFAPIYNDVELDIIGEVLDNPSHVADRDDFWDLVRKSRRSDLYLEACLQILIGICLSLDFQITGDNENPQKQAVRTMFDRIKEFQNDKRELVSGIYPGYSISEICWQRVTGEKYDGILPVVWEVKELKQRAGYRFKFDIDNWLVLTEAYRYQGERVPVHKFLTFVFNSENDNPYGRGIIEDTYWAWYKKQIIEKLHAQFLEKYGGIALMGTYPANATDAEKTGLLNALKGIYQKLVGIKPEGTEIEPIPMERTAVSNVFLEYKEEKNREYAMRILGHAQAAEQQGSGAYSAEESRSDRLMQIVEGVCNQFDVVMNQLVDSFLLLNFGAIDETIRYQTIYPEVDTRKIEAEIDQVLSAIGLPLSKEEAYERYERKNPEQDEDILSAPQPEPQDLPEMSEEMQYLHLFSNTLKYYRQIEQPETFTFSTGDSQNGTSKESEPT